MNGSQAEPDYVENFLSVLTLSDNLGQRFLNFSFNLNFDAEEKIYTE